MSCYTGISAGEYHSLALLKDGRVTGWGDNTHGQITIPAGIGTNATGISAGHWHSLALLKDGSVTGWGRSFEGQINIPAGIGNNATGIAAGWHYSLALLKDGRVTGWGWNGFGQINIPVGIGNNAVGISAGWYHSLALLKDGSVTSWGDNTYGQININATEISARYLHSLALLKDGSVTGWGAGATNTNSHPNYGQIIIPVGIGNNATGISAGFYHSLALLKDGRVTGWGNNDYGQINIPVGIGNNAVGISAGFYHSLALLKDGRVIGWGRNLEGQINIPACPKIDQTIAFSSISTKTFGDAPFTLTATASSNLVVSYTSSNTSVATVAGNVVTIVGGGTTTITASQAGDSNYNAATSVSQTLTINKANQTITFNALAAKSFGDAPFSLTATTSSNLGVSYTSSNTSVATVAGNVVTIVGVGTTTITASQVGDSNYNEAESVSRSLIITKISPTINFPIFETKTDSSDPFSIDITSNSNGLITYSSSNTSVATINQNGIINIIGIGSTEIIVFQNETSTYSSKTLSQTLNVERVNICGDLNITKDNCEELKNNFSLTLKGEKDFQPSYNSKHKLIILKNSQSGYLPFNETEYFSYNQNEIASYSGVFNTGNFKAQVRTIFNDNTNFIKKEHKGIQVLNLVDYSYKNEKGFCLFKNSFRSILNDFLKKHPLNEVGNVWYADNPYFLTGNNFTNNENALRFSIANLKLKEKEYEGTILNEALDYATGNFDWDNSSYKIINIFTNNHPLLSSEYDENLDCQSTNPLFAPSTSINISGVLNKIKLIKQSFTNIKINVVYSSNDLEKDTLFFEKIAQIGGGIFEEDSIYLISQSLEELNKFVKIDSSSSSSSSSNPCSAPPICEYGQPNIIGVNQQGCPIYECPNYGAFTTFLNTNYKSNLKLSFKFVEGNSGVVLWGDSTSSLIPQNAIFTSASGYTVSRNLSA